MKNILSYALPICFGLSLILGSCAKDNSVSSNHRVQKRKYNTGYHIALNKKKKTVRDEQKNEKNETVYAIIETNASTNKVKEERLHNSIQSNESLTPSEDLKPNTILSSSPESSNENKAKRNKVEVRNLKKSKTPSHLAVGGDKKNTLSKISVIKQIAKTAKKESKSSDLEPIIYILLCIFIPFVAVGLATDWEVRDVVINLLLCCLCGIPGIIHAFIVCNREGVI